MDTEQVTYSSKSTAARGAKRLGVVNPNFEQLSTGRWVVSGGIPSDAKPMVNPDRPGKKKSRKQQAKAERAAAKIDENAETDEPTEAEIVAESERMNREFDPVATGAAIVDQLHHDHDDLPPGTYTVTDTQYNGAEITGTVLAPDGSSHTVTFKDHALAAALLLPTLPGGINLNDPEKIIPKRSSVAETYDELEAIAPLKSQIVSPVAFIWAFLDLQPGISRKEAVAIFVKNGINIHTARTQFQAYRAAGGMRKK